MLRGNSDIVNVLWTGGLDSTYLIVKLCIMGNVKIQPYYIIDEGRESTGKELQAIKKITSEIRQSGKIKSDLLDAIIVERKTISDYPDITKAWKRLNKKYALGSQYDWLARFARQEKLKLMVGVQMEQRGKVVHTLQGKEMIKVKQGSLDVFSTNGIPDLNKDATLLYENLQFPCFIVGLSKVQEWEDLYNWGFKTIANMTWFCHTPIFGMTCGHCNPCKDALMEGMAFRVSKIGYAFGAIKYTLKHIKHIF